MFTEILRIKPVLDSASASQMENNLGGRFRRVTTRFGQGLKMAIKGSLLGISLGLLARFLNPLEKMEEKIRKLLDEAKAQKDSAEDFGTSPGKLRAIQDVAGSIGVTPDTLKEMMGKYAGAIEKAREELQDPTAKLSEGTQALRQFIGEKDMAESFLQFVQSLKTQGNSGKGFDRFFGERENRRALERQRSGEKLSDEERASLKGKGLLKEMSPQEVREMIEKAVFGESQKGQGKRLIDANFAKLFQHQPASVGQLDSAYGRLDKVETIDRNRRINRDTQDLLHQSRVVTPGVVGAINDAQDRRLKQENEDFKNFDSLKRAQESVDKLTSMFEGVQRLILLSIDGWNDIIQFITDMKHSRWYRLWKGGGK